MPLTDHLGRGEIQTHEEWQPVPENVHKVSTGWALFGGSPRLVGAWPENEISTPRKEIRMEGIWIG